MNTSQLLSIFNLKYSIFGFKVAQPAQRGLYLLYGYKFRVPSYMPNSAGASMLLKYLSEENVENSIAGLFLIAAPY